MIFVIEGPDKCGKSTLSKYIADKLSAQVYHFGKPKTDNVFKEYSRYIEGFESILDRDRHIVLDRFHLGEFVYSTLWRDGCKVSHGQFKMLEIQMANIAEIVLIHADAPTEVIIERMKKDGEDLLKPEEVERCRMLFNHIVSWSMIPKFKYDSTVMDHNVFADTILKALRVV